MKRRVVAATVCLIVGSSLLFAQTDPRIGRWKVNTAKSTYDPGPAPKEDMRTYEATADGTKATIETTSAAGSSNKGTYTAKLDGKDYPITGSQAFDAISLKRIDDYTVESTLKKGGKVVQTSKAVVSKDGRTMTTTVTGTNPSGQKVHNVVVFDKQP